MDVDILTFRIRIGSFNASSYKNPRFKNLDKKSCKPIRLGTSSKFVCVCVFIPSPVRVGTLLMEVPGTPIGASFFEFELKPTGKDSADPTQHEFQHHIL